MRLVLRLRLRFDPRGLFDTYSIETQFHLPSSTLYNLPFLDTLTLYPHLATPLSPLTRNFSFSFSIYLSPPTSHPFPLPLTKFHSPWFRTPPHSRHLSLSSYHHYVSASPPSGYAYPSATSTDDCTRGPEAWHDRPSVPSLPAPTDRSRSRQVKHVSAAIHPDEAGGG